MCRVPRSREGLSAVGVGVAVLSLLESNRKVRGVVCRSLE